MTKHKFKQIAGLNIFYREAGNPRNPTIVLLHGFPSSSHMFNNLLNKLKDRFHLIAPDYPGFGNSEVPNPDQLDYTFDHFAEVVENLLESLNLGSFSIYLRAPFVYLFLIDPSVNPCLTISSVSGVRFSQKSRIGFQVSMRPIS